MKKIIVVVGMHRSGTSAITRGLELLGADLGSDLMPAIIGDNDKGFWEDIGIYNINERLLSELGMRWDSLSEIPSETLRSNSLEQLRQDAIEVLRSRTAAVEIFAFKDPRTVNLLPFWQGIFRELELDDRYLIILRNPMSVADSLKKRNGFDREKSFWLWMKHSCNGIVYTQEKKTVLVDFDRFLDSPLHELGRIASALELPDVEQDSLACKDYVDEFLSSGLRHTKYQLAQAKSDVVPPFVSHLYELLLDASMSMEDGVSDLYGKQEWRTLCAEFSAYRSLFAYIDRLQQRQEALERRYASLEETSERRYSSLSDEFSRHQSAHAELQQKHADTEQELSDQQLRFYSMLVSFDRSLLGRLVGFLESFYLAIRLRRRDVTPYRRLVNEGVEHLDGRDAVGSSESEPKPGRPQLVWKVLSYTVRHPYSSVRLINTYRLKKLISTVLSADQSTARSWIAARFPNDSTPTRRPKIFPVSAALDDAVLEFPAPEASGVRVSIVIPVYNQYRTSISCLKSVLAHTAGVDYEVIIADDCSTDITSRIESKIKGVRVIRGEQNMGFLRNCNHAVKAAQGSYVVLLNNDTNVQANWLQPLIDVLERDPEVGLVGPKLLFEDGKLQEAGGIIWQDGSGWNYGRGHNSELPEFNYLRETDYVSGACLLIRRSVWDDLDGFDEAFLPAYYEDTDLAFRIRQRGLKVVYQPESVVVHFEGVSNGTDLSGGIKKYQARNQRNFVKKWHDVLIRDHFPNAENVFQARDRSRDKKVIVLIDHYVPFYDKDAGSRSTYIYIKAMIEAGLVVKFCPANFFAHQPYTRALQQLGVEVLVGERLARSWKEWFSDNSKYIDVIYLHRPHIAEEFIDHLAALEPRPKLIFFGHDLHYLRVKREAELRDDASILRESEDWKRRELTIFGKVDIVYYPSQVEVDEVRRIAPSTNVAAIPLYLLEQPVPDAYHHAERSGLLFVGGFGHPPNEDAVLWFAKEIMPLLLSHDPDIRLHVVGSSVPDSVNALASVNIVVHGFISDEELTALYGQVRISVVPLRYGAGVKGKILEALQAGLPIVTTPIGAEGIPDAKSVMVIENDPAEMAERIWELHESDEMCSRYLSRYPAYIREHFSPAQVYQVIERDFLN